MKLKEKLMMDQIHTTRLGIERIKRNLGVDSDDIVTWCKAKMSQKEAVSYKQGKNWYVEVENYRFTVNASSYTMITAHKIDKK